MVICILDLVRTGKQDSPHALIIIRTRVSAPFYGIAECKSRFWLEEKGALVGVGGGGTTFL